MIGPQSIDIALLGIGDHVKVVGEDGSFEATIVATDPLEGVTFKRISDGVDFVISYPDFEEYDLYPRGETIRRVDERRRSQNKSFAPLEQLLENNHSLSEAEKKDQEEIENTFFILFDEFQNTSLGDQKKASGIIEKMEGLAEGNPELQEALIFLVNERIDYLKKAQMV
jgi:hypothetical protein